ncbi:adenylate/guanylate cyclase domain-containing protein [Bradyrhizobium centrosematis]|uniref:adenylate/guanylate cyclase domain-containing protein n=1 Tax=Bradyrhizobium centrosematis TaxID=1300039 RepID=UPI002169071E|nr:adenylate/guanylate cyclase domain-containing protein [Bradyrhizobium centrosematis]MCS3763166.1 TolB-like protein/class 3 adenylate cyclase [Bradyrhizobium centrosematis]MCS3775833.1 TolB-like protein/class 3 adenylate cyclase [Bradyrhizobium centrosematis]
MADERMERRLAAVLAADVAGYSLLMGRDEEGTLTQLKAFRTRLVDPTIAAHRGRIVKTTGDGMLVEFASAVDAARCAVEVQRGVALQNFDVPEHARIEFRIGIHVGDIIVDDDDIFGDGVNIAARLEGIAQPGGICVSDDAQRQIRGKLDSPFEDLGPQNLKNIAEPMRAWRLSVDAMSAEYLSAERPALAQALTLPDKPSIAVLPFQNMSSDPEQEYFADGIVEDIITALSRYHGLFVIARNSSFAYKGQAVDIKRAGRELGVRYVLEGSVRKIPGRVRVTGQLIDASTGAHLWADRFDGAMEDIFDLQDDITLKVVGAIAPKLENAEINRSMRKPTESLIGYDYHLRAMARFHRASREDIKEAIRLFHKASEFDEGYSSAYGMAAWCYARRKLNGWTEDRSAETLDAERLVKRVIECGSNDAVALASSGIAVGYMFGDFERAMSLLDRAQELNPNLAMAFHLSGWIRCFVGNPDLAIIHLERAVRLSPLDPQRPGMLAAIAAAHFAAGRLELAASLASKATLEQSDNFIASLVAAASNALAGNLDAAKRATELVRASDPGFRIQNVKYRLPHRQPEVLARWEDALRRAGMPE